MLGVALLGLLLSGLFTVQASAAVAPKGVTGFFGASPGAATSGEAAGQMNTPRGVAVNQGTGNVYAADSGNNRVVVFNSSGTFLRAFGADVVAYGPDQANEVQALDVNAAAGNFKLTFEGQPTSELAATAGTAEVQAALNALSSIGGLSPAGSVTVSGGPGNAGGASPYRITFGGSLGATNVPQITATNVSLSGGSPATAITAGTLNDGEAGFEVCVPASDACKIGIAPIPATGGAMSAPQGIAVNQVSGDVYVTDQGNRRVQQFSATGNFIRAFGKNVVATGFPGNSAAASAVQTLTVAASAGKYKLKFGGLETAELPFNATAGEIQTALQGLASIGSGNATVTGTGPYAITFAGALANNPEPLIATESGPGEQLVGGTATVVNATTGSNEYEICSAAAGDVCTAGATTGTTIAGGFGASVGYPAVAPTGAANQGDVLVADATNRRVQEFSSAGAFLRAFGQDVVSAGPNNNATNFEVCSLAAGDACKAGTAGSGSGQFATNTPTRVAEDAGGNLYTVEPAGNFRVQKFTLPSNVVTPQGPFDAADLTGASSANAPTDVAVNPSAGANVLVTKGFPAGATPSCPITGAASAAESRVLEVSAAGALEGTHGACAGITVSGERGLASRQSTGDLYVTSILTASRIYVLNTGQPLAPAASITNVSGIEAHRATVSAFVNANGPESPYGQETTYRLEYKRSADPTYTPLSGEAGAGNGTANTPITQQLDGLQAGTSYDVRLVASKGLGSGNATSTTTFSTTAAAPEPIVAPAVYLDGTTAIFGGTVNPNNSLTSYHFEYVDDAAFQASGFTGATSVPSPDASAGSGGTAVSVAQKVTGLASGTYHLRLVAGNGVGPAASVPTTFTVEASGGCANEAIREAQKSTTLPNGTAGLPDCMALEMVSPAEKENQPIKNGGNLPSNSISIDGDRAFFRADAAFAETAAVVNAQFGDVYVASRGKDGWTTKATILRPMNNGSDPYGFAPDLSSWFQIPAETEDLNAELKDQAFGSTLGGPLVAFSSLLVTADAPQANASYAGSSEDASHLYIKFNAEFSAQSASPARLYLSDPKPAGPASRPNIYVLTRGPDGEPAPPQLLARDEFGKAWGANCGARIGGDTEPSALESRTPQRVLIQGAISSDGSRVYFSTRPTQPAGSNCSTANKMRILERAEATPGQPVITELVQNECDRVSPAPACDPTDGDDNFQGASADGSKVYFTTTRQLVNSDLDSGASCGLALGAATGCDLYLYEKLPGGGHNLVQVSAGDVTDPTPGTGAKVLNNIAGISTDGSHVYFAAEGVLTTAPNEFGTIAKAGQPNLYLYERDPDHPNGRTVFIGTLASGDSGQLWGDSKVEAYGGSSVYPVPAMNAGGDKIGGDGHVLLFRSKANLVPNDTDTARRDVYRYDSEAGSLQCVSCLPGSDGGTGEAAEAFPEGLSGGTPRGPAFASLGRWVSEDGKSVVFETDAPLLPSDTNSGTDEYLWREGQLTLLPGADLDRTEPPTISGDGSVIAFRKGEQLLPEDGDGVPDLYSLRSGGGFPIPPKQEACVGEHCQEPFRSQPSPATAGSETANGENVVERPPCKKGFVRRKGKCVKHRHRGKHHHRRKHHHKKKHHQGNRAAGNRQGGAK